MRSLNIWLDNCPAGGAEGRPIAGLFYFRIFCNISFLHPSNQTVNISARNNWSDRQLVEKVLGGDNAAFGLIIKNTESLVAQIVFKMIDNPEDRKDLAQDIYLKVFHKLSSFKFESKLSTWIAQVSYNRCFDYLRKKKLVLPGNLEQERVSNEDYGYTDLTQAYSSQVTNDILQKNLSVILHAAIEKLSPVYRTLIGLYHQQELSYDEIGYITGLPEGTVKSYLFRARKALRENLLIHYKKEDLC